MQLVTISVEIYPDGRMDRTNAAKYTGLAKKTMDRQRCEGIGPKFVKRGRIFYYKQDLDEWMREGLQQSTAG